ncbi:tyrosine-type recombinase/integrase [Pectobacterium carotovorum]|uniref:tyrosine-type recombinase/integrase n=1 Tax=Pectobacterium carotovorum TaxID=554 RepID=UPI000507200A|nr:site-specific integrase [Pectobacterium carotovorum]KFX00723.1 integrase [Pectobacterium carotovorum subsp. carotovorum]KML70306.1 integrase [Pectobacterium carotovorum subsp. carotovorum ICMP 5702]SHG90791.1 Phage integrase family protein [Pectobacterium carotovorum]
MERIVTNTFMFENGERYCHVIDKKTGEPLYDPTLYITTRVRNRSESINTMEAVAGSLALLYRFFSLRRIDIRERIATLQFLALNEIDDLADFASKNFKNKRTTSLHERSIVKEPTKYFRLTVIFNYLEWLCEVNAIGTKSKDNQKMMDSFIDKLKNKRPSNEDRYKNQIPEKTLSREQLDILFEVVRPGSELNPFADEVQSRNRLIILLLFSFGIRAGELLNLRIRDIDFSSGRIVIKRRPDDKFDPRVNQPLVKTCERMFSVGNALMAELFNYITQDRRNVKNSKDNDFLFITYKKGYSQGKPLSFSAYHKIINMISETSPELAELTGHKLRHTWNYEFSSLVDGMDETFSEEKEEQIRSYLMGWKTGSGTAQIYNRRHLVEEAHKTSLAMQNQLMEGYINE